jgi:transcriptional regulator with XRE-family HTH domain
MAPTIGRSRVPEWLKKTGKKQIDLAKCLKVDKSYISRLCRNSEVLSVVNMRKTALFFGCNMDDLVDWSGELSDTRQ